MPGTGIVSAPMVPLVPLRLTSHEDSYHIQFARDFTALQPLSLRLISDNEPFLVSLAPGGPYMLGTTGWPTVLNFTGKAGDALDLYFKTISGFTTLYLCPVDRQGT